MGVIRLLRLFTKIQGDVIERRYFNDATLRGSASQAVSTVTITFDPETRKIVLLGIDVTDVGAAGTLTLTLQYQEFVTGNWVNVKALGAFTTVGTRFLMIGIGLTQADAAPLFFSNTPAIPNSKMRISAVVAVNAVTWSLSSSELESS